MDMKMAAQVIRDSVSMEQILGLYGYTAKHGFMVCPFHGDNDPSLKVYTGRNGHSGWHCFGCQRGGSVIDFVQEHEGCDFRTAVRAIDNALGMNLFPTKENPYQVEKERRRQKRADEYAGVLYAMCDAIRRGTQEQMRVDLAEMKRIRAKEVRERSAQEWTRLDSFDDESQWNEDLLDRVEEFREVVAAWRRKARKARSA